jgi:hypothetical protein
VRDLLFVITGFTLGHSLTLGLAVTGILRPNPQYIDALVALTIALIGAGIVGDSTHRPVPIALSMGGLLLCFALAQTIGLGVTLPATLLVGGAVFSASFLMLTGHMSDAGRVRLVMTLVFGLIHGFGFASNLWKWSIPATGQFRTLINSPGGSSATAPGAIVSASRPLGPEALENFYVNGIRPLDINIPVT